jgi:hypothetical protein
MAPIFELADVANVLNLDKTRVKNWTEGRPFVVRPSIRASTGKGSRNWFSPGDLYSFELIRRLIEMNAPVDAIQQMLDGPLLTQELCWVRRNWLFIKSKSNQRFEILFHDESNFDLPLDLSSDTLRI